MLHPFYGECEEIEVAFRWGDLAEEGLHGEDPATADEDRSSIDFDVPVVVSRVASMLFRVVEPTSLTPFGPYSHMLSLGDVIEAIPQDDEIYRYSRIVVHGRVSTRVFHLPHVPKLARSLGGGFTADRRAMRLVLGQGRVRAILDELKHAGAGWEYMVGNLTVQVPLQRRDREPSGESRDLIAALHDHLAEDARKYMGFSPREIAGRVDDD